VIINIKGIKDDFPESSFSEPGKGDDTCEGIQFHSPKGHLCTLISKLEGKDGESRSTLIDEGLEDWTATQPALESHSQNTVCGGFVSYRPQHGDAESLSRDSEIGNRDIIGVLESEYPTLIAISNLEHLFEGYGSRRLFRIIPIAAKTSPAVCVGKEKMTAASVKIDLELNWRSSDGDGTSPHHAVVHS
jgi:hypothetical protein